jgi:hypothetical protein
MNEVLLPFCVDGEFLGSFFDVLWPAKLSRTTEILFLLLGVLGELSFGFLIFPNRFSSFSVQLVYSSPSRGFRATTL